MRNIGDRPCDGKHTPPKFGTGFGFSQDKSSVDFGSLGEMALQFSRAHNFLFEVLKAGGFQWFGEKIGAIFLGGDFDQLEFAVLDAVHNFVPISAKILCL